MQPKVRLLGRTVYMQSVSSLAESNRLVVETIGLLIRRLLHRSHSAQIRIHLPRLLLRRILEQANVPGFPDQRSCSSFSPDSCVLHLNATILSLPIEL